MLERLSGMATNPKTSGELNLMFMIQGKLLLQNTGYNPLPKGQVSRARGTLLETLLVLQKMQVKKLVEVSRSPFGETERMRRERPGGKRKYKTRHMESTIGKHTNLERQNDPRKTLSKFSDCYESENSLFRQSRKESDSVRKKEWGVRVQRESEKESWQAYQRAKAKQKHWTHHMSSQPVLLQQWLQLTVILRTHKRWNVAAALLGQAQLR